jgi:hypothetical protein
MAPVRADDDRTWQWCGRAIHLIKDDQPRLVLAALLAYRDASTPEDGDVAELLVWTVEEHPPWDDHCPTCGTDGACDTQRQADELALDYLIRKSTELVRRSRERIASTNREDVA